MVPARLLIPAITSNAQSCTRQTTQDLRFGEIPGQYQKDSLFHCGLEFSGPSTIFRDMHPC